MGAACLGAAAPRRGKGRARRVAQPGLTPTTHAYCMPRLVVVTWSWSKHLRCRKTTSVRLVYTWANRSTLVKPHRSSKSTQGFGIHPPHSTSSSFPQPPPSYGAPTANGGNATPRSRPHAHTNAPRSQHVPDLVGRLKRRAPAGVDVDGPQLVAAAGVGDGGAVDGGVDGVEGKGQAGDVGVEADLVAAGAWWGWGGGGGGGRLG